MTSLIVTEAVPRARAGWKVRPSSSSETRLWTWVRATKAPCTVTGPAVETVCGARVSAEIWMSTLPCAWSGTICPAASMLVTAVPRVVTRSFVS